MHTPKADKPDEEALHQEKEGLTQTEKTYKSNA